MKEDQLDFYSFFTQYSLMEEYGFSSGIISRLFRKILPKVPAKNTVEYVLINHENAVSHLLSILDLPTISRSPIARQLDMSIKALCTKLIAFGLDSDIKSKYNDINLDSQPFEELFDRVFSLSEDPISNSHNLLTSLDEVDALIVDLRKNKNQIGTSIHLTLITRRILEYVSRLRELLNLRLNINSEKHWKDLFNNSLHYSRQKNSLLRYIKRHSDLLALEIVEHTSNKGQKYIAENRKDYWSFFRRSLLGGSIIAVFAFAKLVIDAYQLSQLSNAFLFSVNYAVCFIMVKQLGGIIATKQPAMTASTIAKNIDKSDDLKIDSINSIIKLVRKVFRSQFISIIGNFLMALSLAALLMCIMQYFECSNLIGVVKPSYLIDSVLPSARLVFYAAIAGCFLAVSGLISGYFDNKVVASKIGYRMRNSSSILLKSNRLATYLEKKAGALIGNISLGFLLGSVFLLSYFLPFMIDIRHIAFSSAYVGYSVFGPELNLEVFLLAISGALLIGFVNFIVSFSITLYLALKSRGVSFRLIPKILFQIIKDFLRSPLYYFVKIEDDGSPT